MWRCGARRRDESCPARGPRGEACCSLPPPPLVPSSFLPPPVLVPLSSPPCPCSSLLPPPPQKIKLIQPACPTFKVLTECCCDILQAGMGNTNLMIVIMPNDLVCQWGGMGDIGCASRTHYPGGPACGESTDTHSTCTCRTPTVVTACSSSGLGCTCTRSLGRLADIDYGHVPCST